MGIWHVQFEPDVHTTEHGVRAVYAVSELTWTLWVYLVLSIVTKRCTVDIKCML